MIGEDYSHKVFRVSTRSSELAARGLLSLLHKTLRAMGGAIDQATPRKSLRRISKGNAAIEQIPVPMDSADIRAFQTFAKKYGVQFAVVQSVVNPEKIELVFKSRHQGNISAALAKYLESKTKAAERPSIKDRLREAAAKAEQISNTAKERVSILQPSR